jgi:hypothetical protein
MELEKICQALLFQNETRRTWTIRLLLSDDYARITSEDARTGRVATLAAPSLSRGTPPPVRLLLLPRQPWPADRMTEPVAATRPGH